MRRQKQKFSTDDFTESAACFVFAFCETAKTWYMLLFKHAVKKKKKEHKNTKQNKVIKKSIMSFQAKEQ